MVGLPDPRYGEVVAAFIVRQRTDRGEGTSSDAVAFAKDVRAWVRERLSHHLGESYFDFP